MDRNIATARKHYPEARDVMRGWIQAFDKPALPSANLVHEKQWLLLKLIRNIDNDLVLHPKVFFAYEVL